MSPTIIEQMLLFRDTVFGNATTLRHGLLPKLAGGTTSFLRADGTWAVPPGGGGGGGIGSSSLIYRYTVTGVDKFSIDTGIDAADAGSNDWTNGDLLEVYWLIKTDEAAAQANVFVAVNNDSSSVYDYHFERANSGALTAFGAVSGANWPLLAAGSGGTANEVGSGHLVIPGFSDTTFLKSGIFAASIPSASTANMSQIDYALGWRSTAAITRFLVAAAGGQKLKVGSKLLIYKRTTT